MKKEHPPSPLSNAEKKERIAHNVREILEVLGLDLTDPSLEKTPSRVASMYVDEIFSGLNPNSFPPITLINQDPSITEIVIVKKIFLISFCEHHLVPMVGMAHVAYLPKGKVLGLSTIHQIVRYFAKRPQLQERLTAQIALSLAEVLGVEDVAVSTIAKHYCVIARGVEDSGSETETHVLRGVFEKDPTYRASFFQSVT